MIRTATIETESSLQDVAAALAQLWRSGGDRGLVVGLCGDLGAGKTTWVRAMLRGLGYTGRVPSPTYTVVEPYELSDLTVLHMDLYRIAEASELEALGVRESFGQAGVWLIVEWPDRVAALCSQCDLLLTLAIGAGETRDLRFESQTTLGKELVIETSEILSKYMPSST